MALFSTDSNDDDILFMVTEIVNIASSQDDVADIWPSEPISWAEFKGDF